MGNLNGPWLLGWVGSQTGCDKLDTYELRSKIKKIFQVTQNGTGFLVQTVEDASSRFALIKQLECGEAVAIELTQDSVDIPYIIPSGESNNLIIPNFPLDIKINGLTGDYSIGNGVYIITTFFLNNAPTYKNEWGWVLQKGSVNWEMVNEIVGLHTLKNTSVDPSSGKYVIDGCSDGDNCQTAYPDTENTTTTTGTGGGETTGLSELPEIENLRVLYSNDGAFAIAWDSFANIDEYLLEISNSPNFTQKTSFTLESDKSTFIFTDLNYSTHYFFRVKYLGYLGTYNGPYSTNESKTTIPGSLSNLTAGVSPQGSALINWDAPANIEYSFSTHIYRSKTGSNWEKIGEVSSVTGVTQYVDTSTTGEGIIYYMVVFNNGNNGSTSRSVSVDINKDKPNPPILSSTTSPTASRKLIFWWNTYSSGITFLYKFNESSWIKYNASEITIPASEGENVFKLKAVDQDGNQSSEVSKRVIADFTAPNAPVVSGPSNASNLKVLNFSWVCTSSDLVGYIYRFNKQVWARVDKTVSSIELESIQGDNLFEIKSIDAVENESPVTATSLRVDFQPPHKPVLENIDSPTNSKSLQFKWIMSGELYEYQYRFYTWLSQDPEPTSTPWNKLDKSFDKYNFTATEGFNKFEIVAVDSHGNRSLADSKTTFVDHTPPASPTVSELDFSVNADKEYVLRYGWTSNDPHSNKNTHEKIQFKYKFNDSDWVDTQNEDEVELIAQEGLNEFKIYAYDDVGNNSSVNTIRRVVDTIAPTQPQITGPLGTPPQHLNGELWNACQLNSTVDEPTEVNISYSFMDEGTFVLSEHTQSESRHPSAMTSEFKTSTVSTFEFIKEAESAFGDWKSMIEDAFPSVVVNFINLGKESTTHKKIPSSHKIGYTTEFKKLRKLADIRIGICNDIQYEEKQILPSIANGTELGFDDIHLDAGMNWKVDARVDKQSYSIRFAMRHYIGRALRLVKNTTDTHGTMHGIETGTTTKNTKSSDTSHFFKTYSFPSLHDKKMRVVEKSKLRMSWKSEIPSLYEWRYAFVSDSGRITTNPRWNLLPGGLTTEAEKFIDIDSINKTADNLRFYVRGVDVSGNTSPDAYVDIKIIPDPAEVDLISISEKCESNSEYSTNKCWDKFGLFSADVFLAKELLDNQALVLELHNTENSFRRYEWITKTHNGKFSVDSLASDSTYNVRVALVNFGYDLVGSSLKSESSLVGTTIGKFSESKQLKTNPSYITKPDSVSLSTPSHFKYKNPNNSKFIYPVGESVSASDWKPTAMVNWGRTDNDTFDYYELHYSETSIGTRNARTNILKFTDQDKTSHILRFPDYDTTYYLMLVVRDIHGNTSKSGIVSYSTVPENKPPRLMSEVKVTTSGDLYTQYDERPGTKWTLAFKFPTIKDVQYPRNNKIPDVEDFARNDYSLSDWMALLGHPPIRLQSETWNRDKTEGFGLWITKDKILDDNFKETNWKWGTEASTGDRVLKISGFSANKVYRLNCVVYDTSGHYVSKTIRHITGPIPKKDAPAPSKPSLDVSNHRYLNGHSLTGVKLIDYQWKLSFSITIKETDDLAKFYLWEKVSTQSGFIRTDIDTTDLSIKKVTNAGYSRYTIYYSGYTPRTRYQFKVDAANGQGKLSTQSELVTYVTPAGDTQPPEPPKLHSFMRDLVGGKDKFVFKVAKPNEPNLTLMIYYTKNVGSADFWKYEHKTFISPSNLHYHYHYTSPTILSGNTVYRVAFMWRDDAYNYSYPVWRNANYNASSSFVGHIFDNSNTDHDPGPHGKETIPALEIR